MAVDCDTAAVHDKHAEPAAHPAIVCPADPRDAEFLHTRYPRTGVCMFLMHVSGHPAGYFRPPMASSNYTPQTYMPTQNMPRVDPVKIVVQTESEVWPDLPMYDARLSTSLRLSSALILRNIGESRECGSTIPTLIFTR